MKTAPAAVEVIHLYCCDPNEGLCGEDLTDVADVAYDETKLCDRCYTSDLLAEPCLQCPVPAARGGRR